MKPSRVLGLLVLCAPLAVAAAGIPRHTAQPAQRVARSFPVSPVKPLEIHVASGSVDIRGEDRGDVSLVVEAADGTLGPDVIGEVEDRIVVDASRPGAVTGPVQVAVRAPRSTPVPFVQVGDGGVAVSHWRGPLQVKVERGAILGDDIAGVIRLETGSGDITLRGAALQADGLLRCRALTGDIAVSLTGAPADARVLLMALSGTVTSDLPVADREGFGGRLKEGVLGNGQPLLSLDTVRGNISVTLGGGPRPKD